MILHASRVFLVLRNIPFAQLLKVQRAFLRRRKGLLALSAARRSQICAFSLLGTAGPIWSISSKLVTLALGRFGVVLLDDAACLFGWASVPLCISV